MKKTVVYQSYRTTNVSPWIRRCLQTVEQWAERKGFEYVFIDDRVFDYVPEWYKRQVNDHVQLMTDLARLELAKEFLSKGYTRTIWIDADVVVFDSEAFDVDVTEEYAFCREVWLKKSQSGLSCHRQVNNAVTVFTEGNAMLEFYVHACKSIVKNKPDKISGLEVGTHFLTMMHSFLYFPLLQDVGNLSPVVLWDLATGNSEYLTMYARNLNFPIRAANLCASFEGIDYGGEVTLNDELFDAAIDRLLDTKGSVVNEAATAL